MEDLNVFLEDLELRDRNSASVVEEIWDGNTPKSNALRNFSNRQKNVVFHPPSHSLTKTLTNPQTTFQTIQKERFGIKKSGTCEEASPTANYCYGEILPKI